MEQLVKTFQDKIKYEGRTFKWFHKTYLKDVSYVYFMIQLHDKDRLRDSIKVAMKKYIEL